MTGNSNVRVIVDFEVFLDRLLAHTQEENCQHTVSDFLQEYFDNKNRRLGASRQHLMRAQQPTPTTDLSSQAQGG